MEEKIFQDIKDYFGEDYDESRNSTLLFCIKRAINSFKTTRNYPCYYTDEMIENDMKKYEMCMFDLTLYWCVMQGMEFQGSHSENGVSRSFKDEREIYSLHNVIPVARIY